MRLQSRRQYRAEITTFMESLFQDRDLVEIRAVETWSTEAHKTQSRVIGRMWCEAAKVPIHWSELETWNRLGGNIFFSVNPRTARDGGKDSVAICRSVWVDIDGVSIEDARKRFQTVGLPPTITVCSGRGVHAYWKLKEPISVADPLARNRFEQIVKSFARQVGGDSTSDVTRLLRVPGTNNVKQFRNGREPTACHVVENDSSRLYELSEFDRFLPLECTSDQQGEASSSEPFSFTTSSLGKGRDHARIRGVLRYLARDVEDRSRRDFGAVAMLLQCGLSKSEIHELVRQTSKFAEAGEKYFEMTIEAARRSLGR